MDTNVLACLWEYLTPDSIGCMASIAGAGISIWQCCQAKKAKNAAIKAANELTERINENVRTSNITKIKANLASMSKIASGWCSVNPEKGGRSINKDYNNFRDYYVENLSAAGNLPDETIKENIKNQLDAIIKDAEGFVSNRNRDDANKLHDKISALAYSIGSKVKVNNNQGLAPCKPTNS